MVVGNGKDTLYGGLGNDKLYVDGVPCATNTTEDGKNLLFGGGGNDTLFGGNGKDILYGDLSPQERRLGTGQDGDSSRIFTGSLS